MKGRRLGWRGDEGGREGKVDKYSEGWKKRGGKGMEVREREFWGKGEREL